MRRTVISILCVALALLVGIFYFSKETAPNGAGVLGTDNWKTYKSEEYGFEVKYPATLKVYDYSKSGSVYFDVEPPSVPEYVPYFIVQFRSPAGDEWTDQVLRNLEVTGNYKIEYSKITVANTEVSKAIVTILKRQSPNEFEGQKEIFVYFTRNNADFSFSSTLDVQKGSTEEGFDKILSTLKFTK